MGKNYDYSYTQDRELSWLKFNERVLREAGKKSVPILERLKFLEIFTNNLDEFYMVRVGSIHEMSLIHDHHHDIRSNLTPDEQLTKIAESMGPLYRLRDKIFTDVSEELEKRGIKQCGFADLNMEEKQYLKNYFETSSQQSNPYRAFAEKKGKRILWNHRHAKRYGPDDIFKGRADQICAFRGCYRAVL